MGLVVMDNLERHQLAEALARFRAASLWQYRNDDAARAGQGAITVARILGETALEHSLWAQAFPEFGPEREGAPIRAYNRISNRPIRLHCGIYEPDIVVVFDLALLREHAQEVMKGLKPRGLLLLNTSEPARTLRQQLDFRGSLLTLDATKIAQDCGCLVRGRPVPNTAILGSLLQVLGGSKLVDIGQERLRAWFRDEIIYKKNRRAYDKGATAIKNEPPLLRL